MTTTTFKKLISPFKQCYVAQQMGISQAYLSQIMKGRQPISAKTAYQMAQFAESHVFVLKNKKLNISNLAKKVK